jgi:hypothetical protein
MTVLHGNSKVHAQLLASTGFEFRMTFSIFVESFEELISRHSSISLAVYWRRNYTSQLVFPAPKL